MDEINKSEAIQPPCVSVSVELLINPVNKVRNNPIYLSSSIKLFGFI